MLTISLANADRVGAQPKQVDQRAVAQQLLSNDSDQRREALATIRTMGATNAGPEIRGALLTLLDAQNRVIEEARTQGSTIERRLDPEFHSRLTQTVVELRDPRTIPALAQSLGTGFVLHRALAGFGEAAAPAVLAVVTSPQSSYDAINEGLIALRFMVEGAQSQPLLADTRQRIAAAAAQHLSQPGRPIGTGTTLRRAIDLAVVLGDPNLRRIVEAIASDPKEVTARGVTDPDLIAQTQRRASDGLAGVPALPRR
jgi:hypothetical protein